MLQARVVTAMTQSLATILDKDIPPDVEQVGITVKNGSAIALDQFEAIGYNGDNPTTLGSASGDFTSPKHPILGASGDLTGLAAAGTGDLWIDTRGLSRIVLKGAMAGDVKATNVLTAAGQPTGGAKGTGTLTLSTAVPTGAIKATGTLTGTTIAAGDTVTADGVTYTFVASIDPMFTAPNSVLVGATDSDSLDNLIEAMNNGSAADRTKVSRFTSAMTNAVASAGAGDTLDLTANSAGTGGNSIATTASLTAGDWGAATLENGQAGETVTIGTTVYTFDDATAGLIDEAYHVLVGASLDATLDNLEAAINGAAGEGTTYGTGTEAHTLVTAANQGDDTLDITTREATGATIATTETGANAAWGATTVQSGVTPESVTIGGVTYYFDAGSLIDEANHVLVGATASDTLDNLIAAINAAAGAGSTYGTGTAQNALVAAAAGSGDTIDLTARTAGEDGNSIGATSTASNLTFTAATFAGADDLEVEISGAG